MKERVQNMNKRYNIIFASHPDYSGNAKALYEYMKKNKKYKDYNLVWVVYDETNFELLKSNDIECVLYHSNKFDKVFKKSNIIFFTHDELIDEKLPGQIYIYLSHGYSCKKFGRILNKNNLIDGDLYYLNRLKENIDYIICASDLWKYIYHEAFDIKTERILTLGTPRTDYIYSKKAYSNLELVCGRSLKKYDKILLYLPTFRSGLGRDNDGEFTKNVLNLEKYDEKDLDNYLKTNNYILLIKYHPYEKNKTIKYKSDNIIYLSDEYMTKKFVTLTEFISAVDLIIADYSSAHTDFLILDKPVCFLNKDIKQYKANRGMILDVSSFWFPGPLIKNFDDFKFEINKLLSDKTYYSIQRKLFVELTFQKNIKNISKNICKYLFEGDFDMFSNSKNILVNDINYKYKKLLNDNDYKQKQIDKLENEIIDLKKQLKTIINSKGWRVLEKIRKVIRHNYKR